MSQSQDMAAINDLFVRTTPKNPAAMALKASWTTWFQSLSTWDRDFDSDTLYDAGKRRDAFNKANSTGGISAPAPLFDVTTAAPVATGSLLGAAPSTVNLASMPLIRRGSKDPPTSRAAGAPLAWGPVHIWQTIVGATPVDGIFGGGTETLTKKWQKVHGLVDDGDVGPLTWMQADADQKAAAAARLDVSAGVKTSLVTSAVQASSSAGSVPMNVLTASNAAASAAVSQPAAVQAATKTAAAIASAAVQSNTPVSSNAFPVLREGSTGEYVKTWQGILGMPQTGNFDAATVKKTKAYQALNGLDDDGVVGPATWSKTAVVGITATTRDPVSQSVGIMWNATRAAVKNVLDNTPTWLKVMGAGALAWTGVLAIASKKPPVGR